MLNKMKVTTKLAVTLLVPLLMLGVLAGVGVADRASRAATARDSQHIAELASAAGRTQLAVALEESSSVQLSAAILARASSPSAPFETTKGAYPSD